jgi:hypothetical protein
MADQPPAHGSDADEAGQRLSGQPVPTPATRGPAEATSPAPRWVKVFGIIGVVFVLLIIVMLLTGHGPGRHMHSGLSGPGTPAGSVLGAITGFDEERP